MILEVVHDFFVMQLLTHQKQWPNFFFKKTLLQILALCFILQIVEVSLIVPNSYIQNIPSFSVLVRPKSSIKTRKKKQVNQDLQVPLCTRCSHLFFLFPISRLETVFWPFESTSHWSRQNKNMKVSQTYVKQAVNQSSLFWSEVQRSTTFTPNSLHKSIQASE